MGDDGCTIGNMYENEKWRLCSGTGKMKYEDKGGHGHRISEKDGCNEGTLYRRAHDVERKTSLLVLKKR